jgi:HEAT repeat protein
MIAYCTHCWREVNSKDKVCPGCETDLTLDHRTYEEKLIGALAHPLPEARVRICWLIGENHIRQAVPDLMRMATNDPDLFVRKASLEGLGTLCDARSASLLRTISKSENRFLAAAAKKSLDAVTQKQESRRDLLLCECPLQRSKTEK